MKPKFKKISDTFFNVLGILVVGAGILFIVFIENPVRFFIYAVLASIIIQIQSFRDFRRASGRIVRNLLTGAGIIYLLFITVLSVSPFLKIQEFKISHLNWKIVEPVLLKPYFSWDSGYKRKGNSYADVYYQYQYKGKSYKNTESEVLKKYYPIWNRKNKDELVPEFSESVSGKIKDKDYILFIHPEQPQQSKLFLSSDVLYVQGSLFYDAVTGFASFIIIFLCIIAAIFILPKKRFLLKK